MRKISNILLLILVLSIPSFAEENFICGVFIEQSNVQATDDSSRVCECCRPPGTGVTGSENNCQRSPAYVKTGQYTTSALDWQIPTRGFALNVLRVYRSTRLTDGDFGIGWTSNLNTRMLYTTFQASETTSYNEGSIMMRNGLPYRFRENGDGSTYSPPEGSHDTLVKNGDGTWDLTPMLSRSRYHYSSTGMLLSQTDEYGNALVYTYDGNNRLDRITDATGSGRYLQINYGANGRISSIQDHTGRTTQYFYDANGSLTTVIDQAFRNTTYGYIAGRYVPLLTRITDHWGRIISDITYDTQDRTKTYSENGETFTYTYNSGSSTWKATSAGGSQATFTYDAKGLVTNATRFANPWGNVTVYNSDGSVQRYTDEDAVMTAIAYNANGSVASITKDDQGTGTGASPVRFEYTYDPNFPEKVTGITAKNPSNGSNNQNWQAWRFDYYQNGSAAPGALFHVYRMQYNFSQQDTLAAFTYNTAGQVLTATDASGATTSYSYDPVTGDLLSVTYPRNSDGGPNPVYTYGRDALGRVTSITDPPGHITTVDYDNLSRITSITLPKPSLGSPLNFTTTYVYDNFDTANSLLYVDRTDPNGRLSRQGYDQFGRLVKSIDTAGNATAFGYSNGVPSLIYDANGNGTQFGYDNGHKLRYILFPDGKTETFEYYADGLLRHKWDRKGDRISYDYDHLNRLMKKTYPNGTSVNFTYVGQLLTSVVDTYAGDTFTYGIDQSYRVNSVTQGSRGTITYTYDGADRITSYAVSGGASANYTYYADGSLSTIQWSPVAGLFQYAYKLNGQYDTVTFPNGQQRAYTYDDQGRLLQLANTLGATNLGNFSYGYDSPLLGQRSSMTSALGTTNYSYDPAYQLSQVNYPSTALFNSEVASWTYDPLGNRTSATTNGNTLTYSYYHYGSNPGNGQLLQSDGLRNYTYDFNGSMTSDGTNSYTWDYDHRLKTISGPGLSATYTYDYLGRRTSKTVGGVTTTFLYNGADLIAESGGSNISYLFGPSIDEPLALTNGGAISYYAADGLGSITSLNDSAGAVQNSYTYDAWGVLRNQTGSVANSATYTGREASEAGLDYYRSRYYSPGIGRFISEDPIRWGSGQPSSYTYVGNDPMDFVDSSGMVGEGRHHPFPQSIWTKIKELPDEALEVIDKAYPKVPEHYFTKEHRAYNDAVRELWNNFLSKKGICPAELTPEYAEEFIRLILKSETPAIKQFLENVMMKLGTVIRAADSFGLLEAFHLELPPLPEEIFMIELGLQPQDQI